MIGSSPHHTRHSPWDDLRDELPNGACRSPPYPPLPVFTAIYRQNFFFRAMEIKNLNAMLAVNNAHFGLKWQTMLTLPIAAPRNGAVVYMRRHHYPRCKAMGEWLVSNISGPSKVGCGSGGCGNHGCRVNNTGRDVKDGGKEVNNTGRDVKDAGKEANKYDAQYVGKCTDSRCQRD